MNKIKNGASNPIIRDDGVMFKSINKLARDLDIWAGRISNGIRKYGKFEHKGHTYYLNDNNIAIENIKTGENTIVGEPIVNSADYQEYLQEKSKLKEVEAIPFEKYDISLYQREQGVKYAVALFSDAHIEETVNANSVLGLNEYNPEIAKKRIMNYFKNLANCLNKDDVNDLIFASLGDTISGYIHDELSQCNALTPLEAVFLAQSLIYSGLEFLCENTHLHSIKFIGIVGNHSRTTKKIQHANGYKMSYEWLMYQNLKRECEIRNLPIEFYLPESEMAVIDTREDKRRFIFIHGFQIKSSGSGTVCGIYPALNRLSMKWDKTFHQDKIYLGHFHTCVSIPNAVVNGSIIGYNTFAMTNGFTFEKPAQQYEVYDTKIGLVLSRQIYCD